MNHYRVTSPARADLRRIWNYTASYGEPTADRLVDDLIARFQQLAEQPELLGAKDEEYDSGCRVAPAGDFTVFYSLADGGIDIVRVIHSRRDIGQLPHF